MRQPLASLTTFLVLSALGCSDALHSGRAGGKADDFASFEEFYASLYCEPDSSVCVVGGDVALADEQAARDYYDQWKGGLALSVQSVDGLDALWDTQTRHDLTYCIDDSFGDRRSEVANALQEATSDWQAVAHVTFTHRPDQDDRCRPSNNQVLFDVSVAPAGATYLARAFFPSYARSSRSIRINLESLDAVALDPEIGDILTLRGVMRHEFGHVLGFRHEHTRPESGATFCFEDDDFRPITTYDAKSTMHYPQCNGEGNWSLELTENDKIGAAFFYPNLDEYEGARCDKELLVDGSIDSTCAPVVREILELANKASFADLDIRVGLDVRAAQEIVDTRASAPFNNLTDLEAVSFLAKVGLRRMYDYLYVDGRCDTEIDDFDRLNINCRPVVHQILAFVNSANFEDLDRAAGLDKRAAANIVAIREVAPFASIADLTAVSFVKTRAIAKLYRFLYPAE